MRSAPTGRTSWAARPCSEPGWNMVGAHLARVAADIGMPLFAGTWPGANRCAQPTLSPRRRRQACSLARYSMLLAMPRLMAAW